MKTNKKWYTMVELMVAILIFTIGFLSAYLLVYSAINSSIRSKNEIIASNIAREQIELIKNVRDTNWIKSLNWDNIDRYLTTTWTWNLSETWFYIIENDYEKPQNPIKITKLSTFDWSKAKVIAEILNNNVRLCLDSLWRYLHCMGSTWAAKTSFYSFIKTEPLITQSWAENITVTWALKIESIVTNTERWYHEFEINTIITDWKK